jgi:hypothetical protein
MTLIEKIEKTRTDVAWLAEFTPSVEEWLSMTSAPIEGARWFESPNVVDLVALREILRKAKGGI